MGKGKTNCECCSHYCYDEECDYYFCRICLDEDEMVRFMTHSFDDCPYFQFHDEYKTVRKQM